MKKITVAAIAFAGGLGAATLPRLGRGAASAGPALLGSTARSWEEIEAAPGKGLGKPIFRAPTATLDELEMHVTHLPAGQAPHPPHQHPQEEVVIIKEGTLEAMQYGKT